MSDAPVDFIHSVLSQGLALLRVASSSRDRRQNRVRDRKEVNVSDASILDSVVHQGSIQGFPAEERKSADS